MPRLQAVEVVPLMSFGVQGLQDLVEALDAFAAGAAVELLQFVSSRPGPGQTVDIAPAELFDTVTVDLLGTVGTMPVGDKGATVPAIDALGAAWRERADAGRLHHRRTAAELLAAVCGEYEAAAAGPAAYRTAAKRQHRFLSLFPMFGSVMTAVFYAKATLVAATIAMIHRGDPVAVAWADHASSLFARFHTLAGTLVGGEIATQARGGTRSVAKLDTLYHVGFGGRVDNHIGDVNGDGKADLIAQNEADTWVMTSTGTGFSAPTQWSNVGFGGRVANHIGDVNGDGKADLIAQNEADTWIMTSTGSSLNQPVQWSSEEFVGRVANHIGDVNGDGKADLIAQNETDTWITTSTGTSFSTPTQWSRVAFEGRVTNLG